MVQRILITGGAGFIGSHLAGRLVTEGCDVVVADRFQSLRGTMLELSNTARRVQYERFDVTDPAATLNLVATVRPHLVFHLAAQPISVLSNRYPEETSRVNVDGTRNVCRAASEARVGGLIFASSACRYGIPAAGASPLREDDAAQPGFYHYSATKLLAERVVADCDVPRVILRFVNVYGPGDRHFSRIIPKLVRAFVRGDEVRLTRGTGDTVLDYLFVDDAIEALLAARAFVAAHARVSEPEVFNIGIGGDHAVSVRTLACMASAAFDGRARRVMLPAEASEPPMVKYLDPAKANRTLGWCASVRLPEGLRVTSAWYREHLHDLVALEDDEFEPTRAADLSATH